MKYRTLFISFLLLFSAVFQISAQRIYQREIKWWNIRSIPVSDQKNINYLYFSDAVIYDDKSYLPEYYEQFKIASENMSLQVSLRNMVFEELEYDKNVFIEDLQDVKTEINIKSYISVARKVPFASVSFIPLRKNITTGKIEKLINFELVINTIPAPAKGNGNVKEFTTESVLNTGKWFKIAVTNTGIHKVTSARLAEMGMDIGSVDPQNIRLYGNGGGMVPESNSEFRYDDLQENAIKLVEQGNGNFYFLFYGESPDTWQYNETDKLFHHIMHQYSDKTYYFITADLGPGKRIQKIPSQNNTDTIINHFNDRIFHDKDERNLIKSGRVWYGEKFDISTEYNFSFNFPNIETTSPVNIETYLAARSFYNSNFTVISEGNQINPLIEYVIDYKDADYAKKSIDKLNILPVDDNVEVLIRYNKPTSGSIGWLNYIEINAVRKLKFTGSQMPFRNIYSVGNGRVSEFNISDAGSSVIVWDVTETINIKEVETQLSGSSVSFGIATDSLKEFIAFNETSFYNVEFVGMVENQNLHGLGSYDYIIVSHPAFLNEAKRLADHHTNNNGLSVAVVNTEQIYNEFSSGAPDAAGIRDFVRMIYSRGQPGKELRYLLLFGDGSYDNKNRIENNTNFIPTVQSSISLHPVNSYVTDDFYGLLDSKEGKDAKGYLDIGIGRFTVSSLEQARDAVNKVINYSSRKDLATGDNFNGSGSNVISNLSDWRNVVCFIADDDDGGEGFIWDSEYLATLVDTSYREYNIDKIYSDAYNQVSTPGGQRFPDVNAAINRRIEKGALIVNYIGHGGEVGWALERILEVSDINNWNNKYNLPVFITATCEFCRFDDPERTSAGELVFLNPLGGGVALFSTTRSTYVSLYLNRKFFVNTFELYNNDFPAMGDIFRLSKQGDNSQNTKKYMLVGDPAQRIAYPEYNITTTAINGPPDYIYSDTLKALSKISVSGEVQDRYGNIMTDFNGIITPTVFDKAVEYTTLGNDPASAVTEFLLQKSILYKGKASVKNGVFSFSFIVPRDISYKFGPGRISYYAQNSESDANGFDEDFIVGGFNENYQEDNMGPDIELYMNDENFSFGGLTDENPMLLAFLVDSSGINTVGNGIGHDIVAVLDDNTDQSEVLNDYYEADLDTYQSGTVRYPYNDLSEGTHKLKLKVWDVNNNSSEAYTEFVVASSAELALEHVLNYPNPFTTSTDFYFEHNKPDQMLEVLVQIFTVSGKLIKTISLYTLSNGYKAGPIHWDGRDDFGDHIGRGVYVYRLSVRTDYGASAEKLEKLVILK